MPETIPPIEVVLPLFESNACASIKRVIDTFTQRGAEYGDTWRNSQHLMLRAVFKRFGVVVPDSILNAIACAVLVDVKVQRTEGGYKDDSLIDLIAYAAFLAEEMRQFDPVSPAAELPKPRLIIQQPHDTWGNTALNPNCFHVAAERLDGNGRCCITCGGDMPA